MKKPKLYKWDYIVVALGLAFIFSLVSSTGLMSLVIVLAVALGIAGVIFLLKLIFSEKSFEVIDKVLAWIRRLIEEVGVYAVLIGFVIALFWFGIKVIASCFQWLKSGYWGLYDYDPACNALGFSCQPSTDFVKINEFLYWVSHFDITIFLMLIIVVIVLAWAWLLKILRSADE